MRLLLFLKNREIEDGGLLFFVLLNGTSYFKNLKDRFEDGKEENVTITEHKSNDGRKKNPATSGEHFFV